MADARLVYRALFENSELADTPIEARYLYVSTIVHACDLGRSKADPLYLRKVTFPYETIRLETIESWRNDIFRKGLISLYALNGKVYLFHENWEKFQHLRSDRNKRTFCPDPKDCHPFDPDNQCQTLCGGRKEEKRSEENRRETEPSAVSIEKDKPITINTTISPELKSCLDKATGLGFNAYACINKLKGSKNWTQEIPDQVLINVCNQYLRDKAKGVIKSEWPWFTKVFEQESQKYFASKQIEDHRKIKDQPLAIKDIFSKIRGEE